MCFAKSTPSVPEVVEPQPVIQHEADASLTKNTKEKAPKGAFLQNVKTSTNGLESQANVQRKTLLGE